MLWPLNSLCSAASTEEGQWGVRNALLVVVDGTLTRRGRGPRIDRECVTGMRCGAVCHAHGGGQSHDWSYDDTKSYVEELRVRR
jgi:hypothetical protein